MSERAGEWMQTFTGRVFWPLDPRADEVHIEDIAHSLAHLCRFAGATREFYSVAEHSVRVSRLVEWEAREVGYSPGLVKLCALGGLLHDASEAYLIDLPRPIKALLPAYQDMEVAVDRVVRERFDLCLSKMDRDMIAWADEVLLATEAMSLLTWPPPRAWRLREPPLQEGIVPWSSSVAKRTFLDRFEECGGRHA